VIAIRTYEVPTDNINSIFREFINFVIAYINNIFIYLSGLKRDYNKKIKRVFSVFAAASLYLDPTKCKFGVKIVRYLRFIIIAREGVAYNLKKIRAIRE